MPAVLLLVLLVLIALVVVLLVRSLDPFAWRRYAVARPVSVSLRAGPSIDGLLLAQRGPLLVLTGARLLEEGSPPVPLDGEVVLERAAVSFVQVLAARSPEV